MPHTPDVSWACFCHVTWYIFCNVGFTHMGVPSNPRVIINIKNIGAPALGIAKIHTNLFKCTFFPFLFGVCFVEHNVDAVNNAWSLQPIIYVIFQVFLYFRYWLYINTFMSVLSRTCCTFFNALMCSLNVINNNLVVFIIFLICPCFLLIFSWGFLSNIQ